MPRHRPSTDHFERRLVAAAVVAVAVGGLVVARLIQVQVVQASTLREEAINQQKRTLPLPAARGAIVDRDGRPLALTLPADRREREAPPRLHPRGRLAAQVIGWTSREGGQEGIEFMFDEVLRGRDGSRVVGANARGDLSTRPDSRTRPPEDGATVVLTLDLRAQSVLERELQRCVEETGARCATALLLEPRSGDIVALASWPSYDPEDPGDSPAEHRRLRAVTDCNEPGSTFKVVTVAACLEEGLVKPETLVESCEELELQGGEILHDEKDFGWVSVAETLILSVNTATAQLARKAGPTLLFEYSRAFGFGCVTGIDLPGESSGILRRPAHWSGRSLETISIGQEVAVTPLQLALAYAAIANDGVLPKPRLVREIRGPHGKTIRSFRTREVRRVMSKKTAQELRSMLALVVAQGTGTAARIPGLTVAGKTGTAQWFDRDRNRYDPHRHIATFAGFVPAEDPVLVGVVVVDRPNGVGYGGEIAAPCFRRIVEGTLLASPEPTVLALAPADE